MGNFRIDKSNFSPEQLATWEELLEIGKAAVDPEAAKDELEGEVPEDAPKKKPAKKAEVEDMEDTKKSAPTHEESPVMKAALEELENLKKSFEMKEMTEVAKKYAPLGKKEDELAQTLYDMKKSNEANYNAYITILDESLAIVEKSGIFAEIGKSTGGQPTASDAESKADMKAKEIMKANPGMGYTEAIAKAWEDPALAAEYDAEYFGN